MPAKKRGQGSSVKRNVKRINRPATKNKKATGRKARTKATNSDKKGFKSSKRKSRTSKAKGSARKKRTSASSEKEKNLLKDSPKDSRFVHEELELAKELFNVERKKGFAPWMAKYSPVLIPVFVGLLTYLYLIFFVFYPNIITNGHYIQFLFFILFVFLLAGVFMYLSIRSELLFVRILSFIFVFVIITFLIFFILLAHAMSSGMIV